MLNSKFWANYFEIYYTYLLTIGLYKVELIFLFS